MSREDVAMKKFLAIENPLDTWIEFIPLSKSKISLGFSYGRVLIGALEKPA